MKFAALLLCVAPAVLAADPTTRVVERVPTTLTENGKPVTLKAIVYRRAGAGPFPTLIFHHGSTGSGNNPASFTYTFESRALAEYFTGRGWLVVFPQRRGRGGSDGLYDEGFLPDRSGYSCVPATSLAGLERAKRDADEILKYLEQRPDVDSRRLLAGGNSRGGILALAHAAEHPDRFVGVLNFVGGWIGDGCGAAEKINTKTFAKAGRFKGPTLWLYGENDSFYGMKHNRRNFKAFRTAGGNGDFVEYALGPGVNGHTVLDSPEIWRERVARFVDGLKVG